MTEPAFSDPRSTATILNEARKGRAGSNPALITRLEELDEHHQELIERIQGLSGDQGPDGEAPFTDGELVEGRWMLTEKGQGAILAGARAFREGGVIPGSAVPHHEHSEPIASFDPAAFVKIAGMEERQSIAAEAESLIDGARRDDYGPVEDSFVQVADLWAGIFGCQVTPQQVAMAMAVYKIARQLTGESKRDNYVDAIGYLLLGAQLDGLREPPPL